MGRSLRIVFYGVNGSGVGHLTRLIAVGRWVRRYAAHAGVRAEMYFLTSSEADSLLFHERFASFKLPSKTAVTDAGIDKITYLSLAKQWVWHSLGLLRPDLFVVDTFPRGSFGELLSALDLCRRRAFIYRPTKEGFAARADFQAMLPLYDAILVPDEEPSAAVLVPDAARARVRHVGPILVRERAELLSRDEARARLCIPEGKVAVYASAGGGGDAAAERQLARTLDALRAIPDLCIVVGAGPLYRGRRVHEADVRWLAEPGASELLAGMDLAVCAAGYNTYHELMHAGVPAVFLPQDKIADDQALRASRAARAGAAVVVERFDDGVALRRAVQRFLSPATRAGAAEAARTLVPRNHARDAAAELLRLVLPPGAVDAAEDAITDEVLVATRARGLALEPIVELMHALAPAPEGGHRAGDGRLAGDRAVELLSYAASRGVPAAAAARLASTYARKLAVATPDERAAAARRLLADLVPFGDWPAAATLLKLLGTERRLTAGELATEVGGFLDALRRCDLDLYRAIALLSAAQGAGGEPLSNSELLRAAAAGLDGAGPALAASPFAEPPSSDLDAPTPLAGWDADTAATLTSTVAAGDADRGGA